MPHTPIIEIIGWTLLHSIWQGAIVALGLFVALRVMKRSTASARYLAACLAICLLVALPAVTFVRLNSARLAANKTSDLTAAGNGKIFGNDLLRMQPANSSEIGRLSESPVIESESKTVALQFDFARFEKYATSLLPFLVWLWFFGMIIRAWRLIGEFRWARRLQIEENIPVFGEWRDKFNKLCDELKIKPSVKFAKSRAADCGAFTIGWIKPVVIVPASAFLHLAPHELEAILKHELAHIRRHDYLVNLVQSLVETVFFYHPATWWISGVIRREREFACDDIVVRLGEDKIVYARALLNLEQIRLMENPAGRLRMAAGGENLMDRVKRIVGSKENLQSSRFSAFTSGLSLLVIAAILINSSTASFRTSAEIPANSPGAKKIAVGFVSLPPLDRAESPKNDSSVTARVLIEKLKAHRIPAMGFVLGAAISDGERLYPARADIVRLWRDAGFEIGIGNFKHVWFYDTPFDEYAAGVEKNERIVKQLLDEKNLPLRYFSYPFLNTGKTVEDKTRFEGWLKERGLRSVAYTMDNQEWMYSYAYDAAVKTGNDEEMKVIRSQFLDYMSKMFDHFEAYSHEMFGRDINQTMVLTPSRLVADTADDLFGMIEKRGYKFVSMEEAQAEEAYQTKAAHVDNKSGISWFERWQMARGKKLRDEPRVSRKIWDIWNQAKDKK